MTKKKINIAKDDKVFYVTIDVVITLMLVVILWPLIFIAVFKGSRHGRKSFSSSGRFQP